MFWDKVSGVYDLFENIYNKSVYQATGESVAIRFNRQRKTAAMVLSKWRFFNAYRLSLSMDFLRCLCGGFCLVRTFLPVSS